MSPSTFFEVVGELVTGLVLAVLILKACGFLRVSFEFKSK